MRTWGEIDLDDVHEDDILDRDKAIVELWDALVTAYEPVTSIISAARGSEYVLSHPVLDKYRDFVERNRS